MKYVKNTFLFAMLAVAIALAPNFSVALTTVDPGDSTLSGNSLPDPVDPGTSADSPNLPGTVDPGTSADSGNNNVPDTVDPGTSADGSDSGNGRNGRNNSQENAIQISNIKVTPAGSSVATTTFIKGQTYTISWSASEQNENTAINIVSTLGANTLVGVSSNPDTNNTFNWTVPASIAIGDYMLVFTDSDNRVTNASDLYRVTAATTLTNNSGTPITRNPSSTQSPNNSVDGAEGEEESELPLVVGADEEGINAESQLASAGSASGASKYFLWLLILLVIIGGILLVREHINKNPNTPPKP